MDQNTFMLDGGDATSNMEGGGGYNTGFVATPRAVVPTPVESLEEFRSSLTAIRRAGVVVTRGEIDPGRVGVGAPLFDRDRNILGSLSFALRAGRGDSALIGRLTPLLTTGAREIERLMNEEPAGQSSSARLRVAR